MALEPRTPGSLHKKLKKPSFSSWENVINLLTCNQMDDDSVSQIHQFTTKLNSSFICSGICSLQDVVHGNSRVADNSPVTPKTQLISKSRNSAFTRSSSSGSSAVSSKSSLHSRSTADTGYSHRSTHLRKLTGCYECHTIFDPSRSSNYSCSECGEIFPKFESLEHHKAIAHAVSELGPDDSSRNIVEIIFKSSWLKKDHTICEIERILKVHNTQRTIQRFEDYRDAVKLRAAAGSKKNPRCAADGNELLRFHAATLTCALGARGSSSLCTAGAACGVCTIIRHGFQESKVTGVRTTATSGRAHDCLKEKSQTRRAMLVCRVVAGRVKNVAADDDGGTYDSVSSIAGVYSDAEELIVFNSRAILPCFVVIYKMLV